MKYGLARIVYAISGITLIGIGILAFFAPHSDAVSSVPNAVLNGFVIGVPLFCGVLCLFRCRHWNREAKKLE